MDGIKLAQQLSYGNLQKANHALDTQGDVSKMHKESDFKSNNTNVSTGEVLWPYTFFIYFEQL